MHVRNLSNATLPFGVAQTIIDSGVTGKKIYDPPQPQTIFSPSQNTYLRSLLFVPPADGRQKFYTWQQKRKMWWRKVWLHRNAMDAFILICQSCLIIILVTFSQFSSHPGRFSLSDIKESTNGLGSDINELKVNILAEFEWGPTVIETINLSPITSLGVPEDQLEALKVCCLRGNSLD